jgi:hypothetical protein
MKLDKKDRERLYKAKGKAITVAWPDSERPRNGKRYVVYGDDGKKMFSVRVERSQTLRYETKASIKLDEDPFLPMIGIGGVRREDGGYETEPERVDAHYEGLLVMEAEARNALHQGERRQHLKTSEARSKASRGRLAREYALRQQMRLETA